MEFALTGVSGLFAITLMYPVDMFKAYIQFNDQCERAKTPKAALLRDMVARNGLRGFYRGIGFVWLRQLVSSPIRYGGFEFCNRRYNREHAFGRKAAFALGAGVVSAAVSTPFDVAVIQKQKSNLDGKQVVLRVPMPLREYRYYVVPNVYRASAFSCSSMLVYSFLGDRTTPFLQSIVPAFFASAAGYPFDLVRSRMMQNVYEARKYRDFGHCLRSIVRTEGARNLYNGFAVFAFRDVPQTFILLYAFTYLKRFFLG